LKNWGASLFEISDQGFIRYYQPATDENEGRANAELAGCNFFNDTASVRKPTLKTGAEMPPFSVLQGLPQIAK